MNADMKWLDNPEVFRVNQLDAHSDHCYYMDYTDMEKSENPLTQSLNGQWEFAFSKNVMDRPENFYEENFDASSFDKIMVPGHIELAGYDKIRYINTMYPWEGKEYHRGAYSMGSTGDEAGMFSKAEYNPVGSYIKRFDLSEQMRKKKIRICFEGVEEAMYLWLNGQFVGYAEDSFAPSEFDLTPFIREKGNVLAVQVHKMSTAAFLEDQDFFRFFGIFRNVTLKAVPEVHLEDVWFQPTLNKDNASGRVSVKIKVTAPEGRKVAAHFVLKDRENNQVAEDNITLEEKDGSLVGVMDTEVGSVKAWDNHCPYLYHAYVELRGEDGEILEIIPYDIGFRRLEMIDKVIYLNGKRLVITGVNRHEWSAKTGRSISMNEMTADIDCMIRNNINAVRTCHYPDQIPWYYLCDKAGIYVMAETNMESHGTFQKLGAIEPSCSIPCSIPQWREAVVDRARSNFETFKNHTAILFWSLGNESYAGDDIEAMNTYFKEKQDGRFVHYESSFYDRNYEETISDVESRMYAKPYEVEEYLNNNPKKPYLLCEYMHDMGNSMGGLGTYMKLIDKYEMYHGGFIWDFIDQALLVKDEVTGKEVLRYGGDFDDKPSDYEFSGNGIVFADRKEKPAMQEVRYYYGLYDKNKLRVVYGDYTLGVHGEGFDYIFSYSQGGLESVVKNGYEWLYRCPRPTFWRALTDNDRGSRFHIKSGSWLASDMFIDCKKTEVIMDGELQKQYAPDNNSYGGDVAAGEIIVKYTYETVSNPATTVIVSYTIDVTGNIKVDVDYTGVKGLPELPVFGMRFIMPTLADKYMYKGLSGETYPDRKAGAEKGIYEVSDLSLTPYLVPQECGMRMDTEWLEITRHTSLDNSRTDSSPQTLRIEKNDKTFAFSCLPYTASEVENATHHEELPPARRTVLCVYGAVRGVGGIDSWGSDVEDDYRISAEKDIHYSFIIR